MYKSTRHTNKTWTYAAGSLGPYVAVSEEKAQQVVTECRTSLLTLLLLNHADLADFGPAPGPLAYTRFANGRLRSGFAYLRKVGMPASIITETPNWLVIAPKLGKVLSRIRAWKETSVCPELAKIHQYLLVHGAPAGPHSRPQFSSEAYRVPKAGASAGTATIKNKTKTANVRAGISSSTRPPTLLNSTPPSRLQTTEPLARSADSASLAAKTKPRSTQLSENLVATHGAASQRQTAMSLALTLALASKIT